MMLQSRNDILAVPARSFASLMELYENNYIFIRRLVPDLDRLPLQSVSTVEGAVDLRLTILERCPYTTTVSLTHVFEDDQANATSPDIEIRIYHDARSAEVLPSSSLKSFNLWQREPQPDPRSLAWRWGVNRFLYRWLRYCLGEGHRFPTAAKRQTAG
jgi:uncharacterized protein YqiB (DUF1249 family)